MPGGSQKMRQRPNGARRMKLKRKLFEQDPHCAYCGSEVRFVEARLDHRIPLSRGGTNDLDNFVLACAPCDIAKADSIWWST